MIRRAPRGIPVVLVLVGCVTRHGPRCGCPYCRAEYAPEPAAKPSHTERRLIPVIAGPTGGAS